MKANWQLQRLDFSDRDVYEDAGWIRCDRNDAALSKESQLLLHAIAALPPDVKVGTRTLYAHIDRGLYARVYDFFNQGDALMDWGVGSCTEVPALIGSQACAIWVNNQWIIKKPNEQFSLNYYGKEAVGIHQIVTRVQLEFFSMKGKTKVPIGRGAIEG